MKRIGLAVRRHRQPVCCESIKGYLFSTLRWKSGATCFLVSPTDGSQESTGLKVRCFLCFLMRGTFAAACCAECFSLRSACQCFPNTESRWRLVLSLGSHFISDGGA